MKKFESTLVISQRTISIAADLPTFVFWKNMRYAWTWNTTGSPAGGYTISVWTRAIGSTVSPEAYKETPFMLSP